jgi:polyisoprenoid-binding protein YceI
MRTIGFILIFIHVLLQEGVTQPIFATRNGTASFVSNAPLEIIKARSDEVHGAIDLSDNEFAFTIDNKSFKGFNSALQQEHFSENYMETQRYPVSSFKGKIIEKIDVNAAGEQMVRAKGILDIHGVSQERIIKGTLRVINNKMELKADFTVLLEDHQIKIPKVVYQKISETIEVSIHAELVRENE